MPLVFDIQRFCVNDGPGIRTTVYLKGCPLLCPWCHNPESNSPRPQLSFTGSRCVSCGACAAACPVGAHRVTADGHTVDFSACTACGACVAACPEAALSVYGREMSVEDIMAVVRSDAGYYASSGGGLTISGGEAMSRFGDTLAIARAAKAEGIPVAVETSGLGTPERFRELAPFVDLFLYDYKVTGEGRYRELIGIPESMVLGNLRALDEAGAAVVLRCPIVPGYSDDAAHLAAIAEVAQVPCVDHVEVLPYHDLGRSKARSIGSDRFLDGVAMPTEEQVGAWVGAIRAAGAPDVREG